MNYVRESYVYHLWLMLVSAYEASALRRILTRMGAWCGTQIDTSRLLAVLCREGRIARSWESSLLCRFLAAAVNLPISLLRWIYGKLQPLFDESFFARLAFRMGDETAIAQSWLILLLWIIPYKRWSNAYTMMGFLLLTALFCVRGMHDRKAALDVRSFGFYPVVFFGAVCAAVPLSAHPSLSARFLMYHAAAALCALITVSAVRHVQDLKRLLGGAAAALAIASLYAVYQRVRGVKVNSAYVDLSVNPDMPGRVDAFFDNPNSFAALLILLLPLVIAWMLGEKRPLLRLLAAVSAVLGVAALAMTYSRASWVGFACAAVVFVFLWKPKMIPLFFLLCLLCIPLLPASVFNRILTITNLQDSSTSSRFSLYEAALNVIRTSPLTGAGLGTAAPQAFIKEHALYRGTSPYVHAHNIYLEVWVETGLIGFAAFFASMMWNIKSAARKVRHCRDSATRTIAAGAAAALCGCMVAGLADYPWHYPRVMCVFWFVFAVAIAAVKVCAQEEN